MIKIEYPEKYEYPKDLPCYDATENAKRLEELNKLINEKWCNAYDKAVDEYYKHLEENSDEIYKIVDKRLKALNRRQKVLNKCKKMLNKCKKALRWYNENRID